MRDQPIQRAAHRVLVHGVLARRTLYGHVRLAGGKKWQQAKGQVRQWWSKLTDDDVEYMGGGWDKFVGRLKERYGYSKELNIERYYRDAPLLVIGEGTNELQKIIIARQLIERNRI